MPKNKIKKGSSKELLCRKEHEKDHWICVFKSQRVRFGKIDFAGLFDCVFVRGKTKRYVSVKNHEHFQTHPMHQEEIRKYKEEHATMSEEFWLWIWKSGRWVGRKDNKTWQEPEWVKIQI